MLLYGFFYILHELKGNGLKVVLPYYILYMSGHPRGCRWCAPSLRASLPNSGHLGYVLLREETLWDVLVEVMNITTPFSSVNATDARNPISRMRSEYLAMSRSHLFRTRIIVASKLGRSGSKNTPEKLWVHLTHSHCQRGITYHKFINLLYYYEGLFSSFVFHSNESFSVDVNCVQVIH